MGQWFSGDLQFLLDVAYLCDDNWLTLGQEFVIRGAFRDFTISHCFYILSALL